MHEEPYGEYSFLLDRTARKVKQFAQQQFKALKFPVTVDQWLIMKNLFERGGMKQNELAELLFKDNPTITRIIDLLCEKKLVVRNTNPADRRSFKIELTKVGRRRVEQMKPKIAHIRLQAWEGLSEKDFQNFRRVLNAIYKNLE